MKSFATFGATVADIELWRCAQRQIDRHGIDAVIMTYKHRCELADAGDVDGLNIWSAIELRVLWLRSAEPDDVAVH